jgi:hypothetical protein
MFVNLFSPFLLAFYFLGKCCVLVWFALVFGVVLGTEPKAWHIRARHALDPELHPGPSLYFPCLWVGINYTRLAA